MGDRFGREKKKRKKKEREKGPVALNHDVNLPTSWSLLKTLKPHGPKLEVGTLAYASARLSLTHTPLHPSLCATLYTTHERSNPNYFIEKLHTKKRNRR